jgi:nitroreductase
MTARHADHPIDPQFLNRWSPRAFSATPLQAAEMLRLLEAARWAPSASNLQPARFAWGLRGDAAFGAILAALVPFNQDWAKAAAGLIVVASKPHSEKNGAEVANVWHGFDAGAAWMSLALQAQSMGLIAHAMGGFDSAVLAAAVRLPAGYALHAVVAVGVQGDAESLPEALRAREMPNGRRTLAEVAPHGAVPV